MTGELKTPGERLQEARTARGLSIADVSRQTKIPDRLLEAIELDDYQKLSGALYVKSFLRTYATCVNLDPQEILDLYERQTGSVEEGSRARVIAQVQDLGPQKITPPSYAPRTIGRPPVGEEAVGGDVWQEDVQIRRIGLSYGSKVGMGFGVLVAVVLIVLVGKGLLTGQGEVSDTRGASPPGKHDPPASAGTAPVTSGLPDLAMAPDTTSGVRAVTQTESMKELPTRSQWPRAQAGDSNLVFAGGQQFSQVVRVLCTKLTEVEVRWFGVRQPLTASWPANPTALPQRGIEAGRAYRVAEGFVLYWGSAYDIEIKLATTSGVAVTWNGESFVLDETAAGRWRLLNPDLVGRH